MREPKKVLGQFSWRLTNAQVAAFITRTGGMIGPVTFDRHGRKIKPFSVAPWHSERSSEVMPSMLRALRGDFFCLPFGGNDEAFRGDKHPPHGETANQDWSFFSIAHGGGLTDLRLSLKLKVRHGQIEKLVRLIDGHHAVYQQHVIRGCSGPMCLGHHPMLKFPPSPGTGVVSVCPFVFGQVYPGIFEKPETFGYQSLLPAAKFDSLESVPMLNGGVTDLSVYPARLGFEDLVMMVSDARQPFGWTAATFSKERYAYVALRNLAVLPSTVLWLSNAGRHYAPWNSRHQQVMGMEDVHAYFHEGLAASAKKNSLNRAGYSTALKLSAKKPTVISYAMVIALLPAGFDRVERVEAADNGKAISLLSRNGKRAKAAVDLDFALSTVAAE